MTIAVMESPPLPRHGAMPTAPYSTRPPSPPSVVIPAPIMSDVTECIKIVPTYENVDPASLSVEDLKIITQNHKHQLAQDSAHGWTYESRRVAQPILDFLYLGPSTVSRDRQWLRDNGITMLLAARDSRHAGVQLMANAKLAQELGIQAEYVDVANYTELIQAFPSAVGKINDHMLNVFRGQRLTNTDVPLGNGKMAIPPGEIRRGKVLVFCETGNDRSAGVVVAYLMSVFGMSMIEACQFIHFKRFCVGLSEDLRFLLRSYEDILVAQRTVHRHELGNTSNLVGHGSSQVKKSKRGFSDTLDEEMGEADETTAPDHERFNNRPTFVPFIDTLHQHTGRE
ncbi:phosphatases II [Hypoxylon cercidicola]|nr:phosphatases II [Hypoxylon cercidicola]